MVLCNDQTSVIICIQKPLPSLPCTCSGVDVLSVVPSLSKLCTGCVLPLSRCMFVKPDRGPSSVSGHLVSVGMRFNAVVVGWGCLVQLSVTKKVVVIEREREKEREMEERERVSE